MQALILAGGLGTRLRDVVTEVPKPLADVGGRPFLHYLLDYLEGQDIADVIISSGYKGGLISNSIGDRYRTLRITHITEPEPLGTGGAIRYCLPYTGSEDLLVLNGDSYFPIDIKAMRKQHLATQAHITIAARKIKDVSRYGSLEINDTGNLTGFAEKGRSGPGIINGGIYLLSPQALLDLPEGKFSFEEDILKKKAGKETVSVFVSDAYFIDIGIPEDYRRASTELPQMVRSNGNT